MKKIVVFVLGPDRTGIIATVSKTLFDQGCNLEDVSQTILQRQFVGIFIASMADDGNEDEVLSALRARIGPLGLFVHLRPIGGRAGCRRPDRRAFCDHHRRGGQAGAHGRGYRGPGPLWSEHHKPQGGLKGRRESPRLRHDIRSRHPFGIGPLCVSGRTVRQGRGAGAGHQSPAQGNL